MTLRQFIFSWALLFSAGICQAEEAPVTLAKPEIAEPTTAAKPAIEFPPPTTTTEKIAVAAANTRERRALGKAFVLLNYSPLDLLIPGKYGFTLGLVRNADQTWEFEYVHGSLSTPFVIQDLGRMTDDRYSLMRRSYLGDNSFNISYGASYFDFSVHLGNKLLDKVSAGNYDAIDLARLQAVGFNLGVGNRWTFGHGITLGIDWISWAQPLFTTKRQSAFLEASSNQNDRDDVSKVLGFVSNFPRFVFLKLQLGILF